jgi:hypothetical protein
MILRTQKSTTTTLCEVWLVISQNEFIAKVPVYLGLNERGHLQGSTLEQPCMYPSNAVTVGNIYGTPLPE